ncbi:hypothetical protein [Joostella sp. CR20]|uniref:hypothetical protein n=1 Tax=Joostella sp. CR20 TaxID=2804312 RepID=UPI00313AB6FC
MKISYEEIKEATLTNNCPECFSNEGLTLTFFQKHAENTWYHTATKEITDKIVCSNCKTTIYPVRWTEDIERVRDFYFKSIQSPKTYFKLTRFSIVCLVAIIAVAILLTIFLK